MPLACASDADEIAFRLKRAQDALLRQGREIRWLQSTILPSDEAWLCLFAARDMGQVRELNELAGLTCDAVVKAQLIRPVADRLRPG